MFGASFSSDRLSNSTPRPRAFTLVELLVVIGIISLLIAILLPSLNKAREASRAVACESNMRQIGIGLRIYAESNKGALPASGDDGDSGHPILMPDSQGWASDALWMNAVAKTTFGKTYNQIQLDAAAGGPPIPNEGDHHVLVCPSAPRAAGTTVAGADSDPVTADGYFIMYGDVNNGGALTVQPRNTFICYAMNYKLWGSSSNYTGKITQLHPPSEAVLVFEKRTSISECSQADDDYYASQGGGSAKILGSPVGRFRGDWRRFSGRHSKGGFAVFGDGHVGFFSLHEILTPSVPSKNWNKPGAVTWNTTGPAGP